MLWHIKKKKKKEAKAASVRTIFSNSLSSHVGKQLEEKPFVRKTCFSMGVFHWKQGKK